MKCFVKGPFVGNLGYWKFRILDILAIENVRYHTIDEMLDIGRLAIRSVKYWSFGNWISAKAVI